MPLRQWAVTERRLRDGRQEHENDRQQNRRERGRQGRRPRGGGAAGELIGHASHFDSNVTADKATEERTGNNRNRQRYY